MVAVARGTEAGFAPRFRPESGWDKSYPQPPASWNHSELEWACYWALTAKMKLRLWEDFSYQRKVPAAGLNKVSPDFRSDFWIFAHGRGGGGGGYRYPMGVILDPLSFFTHKSKGLDILKRQILASNGFLCIFLDSADLYRAAEYHVRLAVRGIDLSSRRSF
jgi:hypothetical protein